MASRNPGERWKKLVSWTLDLLFCGGISICHMSECKIYMKPKVGEIEFEKEDGKKFPKVPKGVWNYF